MQLLGSLQTQEWQLSKVKTKQKKVTRKDTVELFMLYNVSFNFGQLLTL